MVKRYLKIYLELLSAEKAPNLALAFLVYETVVQAWEQSCVAIFKLSCALTYGVQKIRKYIVHTQDAPVHALGIIINPGPKLGWIQGHWTPAQASQASATIKSEVMQLQRAIGVRKRIIGALLARLMALVMLRERRTLDI
ncbi:hypothetical protein FRC12_015080 [Ceratobasidium sp. 428]|nr:hypothetical protein FRC12_015080 [Ceratobasidium sp. 428]